MFGKKEDEKEPKVVNHIENCTVHGVHYDKEFTAPFKIVAESLTANAEALKVNAEAGLALAKLFTSQNINIGSMMTFHSPGEQFKE